jgi:ABC-type multidrug transport system permease subunit
MLNKIIQIALNDLRVSFREGGTLVMMVLVPVVLVIAVALANGAFDTSGPAEPETVLLDVVDQDQSELSGQFLQTIRSLNENLVLCPSDDADNICALDGAVLNTELGQTRLNDGVVDGYLEIPTGFGETLLSDGRVDLVYRSDAELGEADPILQTVQVAAQRVSASLIARQMGDQIAVDVLAIEDAGEVETFTSSIYQRAGEIWATNPIIVSFSQADIDTQVADSASQQPGFRQSVPGMGSMYVMFVVLAGTSVLLNERKTWTLQRLMTMPVTGGEFIAGKMLSRFLLGMLQYAVAFGVGLIFAQILGFSFGSSPIALILVMAAFVICICGLALLLATFVKTDQQAGSIVTLLALILAPIGGAWWSLNLEFIPSFMRQIAWLSPIKWAMEGFGRVIYDNGGIIEVLPFVAMLLAAGVTMGAIAASRFKFEA